MQIYKLNLSYANKNAILKKKIFDFDIYLSKYVLWANA